MVHYNKVLLSGKYNSCRILTSCAERIAGGTEKTYNKINYELWNDLKFCKYNPKKTCHKGGNEYEKEKMV